MAAPEAVEQAVAAPEAVDQAVAAPEAVHQAQASEALRGRSMLLGFTGLIPLALMIPILMLHLYAVGIIEGLVAGVAVISYHQARRQGITSLELLGVSFATLTAVLYFGFGNETIIKNLDVAIYTLLAVLVTVSLIRRQPWTAQFARRVVPPEMWERPEFQIINMRLTALWAAAFVVCDLIATTQSGAVRHFVPIAILFMTAALVPRIARWYRTRLVAAGIEEPA
jgi:hypothetical protein